MNFHKYCIFLASLLHFVHLRKLPAQYSELEQCLLVFIPGELAEMSDQAHVLCDGDDEVCDSSIQGPCKAMFLKLAEVYLEEVMVEHTYINNVEEDWLLNSLNAHQGGSCFIAVYPKPLKDRTCLMSPQKVAAVPKVSNISRYLDDNINNINTVCGTFRNKHGGLNKQGLHRDYIQSNLFSVSSINGHISSGELLDEYGQPMADLPKCERVDINSWQQFFNDHLQLSKPVIITNALSKWNASRWSTEYLVNKYGNRSVHIKLSPTTDYEGVEQAELWDTFKSFKIPPQVYSQLQYPDLVVPRPAPVNMKFADYLYLMQNIAEGKVSNASAYLEYSSIRQYFPELEEDIAEMPFLNSHLALKQLNIWLSDGNTRGKLHFDPYDNFLCMIDGSKELTLFEPHDNQLLYEAHIPEGQFSVNMKNFSFRRHKLLDSTSMVMSPFDIRKPDFKRFPKFRDTMPLNCTIHEGDALFMPAFWWHEVQSYRSLTKKRNLAVNYWYEPFFTKEFPCPQCKLHINPFYFHLL